MNTSGVTLILVSIILVWLITHAILNVINMSDALGGVFKGGAPPSWAPMGVSATQNLNWHFIQAIGNNTEGQTNFENTINSVSNNLFGRFSDYNVSQPIKDALTEGWSLDEYTLTPKTTQPNTYIWKVLSVPVMQLSGSRKQSIYVGLVLPNGLIVRIV